MKNKIFAMLISGIIVVSGFAEVKNVNEKSEKQWLNYTLPLPHEIAIKKENIVSPKDIGIKLPAEAGSIEKNAATQLKQFFKEKTGVEPMGNKFEIILGTLDKDGKVSGHAFENASKLKELPNSNQAYLIQASGDNRLVLAALDPKGIFYAAQTLKQLLCRKINQESVSIPLAKITDWPDFDERGAWNIGYKTPGFIPWLASLKLNFTHAPARIILKKGEKARSTKLPVKLIKEAENCAFNLMPHLTHFDYFWRCGMNDIYPELVGKGDGARNPCYRWGGSFKFCRCPCLATPLFTRLITEWVESAAEQGAREVSLWLSERVPCQCECKECLKDGRKQFQKETKACVDAVMAVRKKYPDMKGRVFFTLAGGENKKNLQDSIECLALLKPGVRAEKVYMRNKVFDKYASDGNWLATYDGPRIGIGYFTNRYMSETLRNKINEYYKEKYSAFYSLSRPIASWETDGYWQEGFANYQYSVLAEWTWNIKGRDLRQFATAWATINNVSPPDLFADWIEKISPIESFVRLWIFQMTSLWIKAADELNKKNSAPAWIKKLPKPEKMRQMLASCDKALKISDKINDKSVSLESKYLQKCLRAMVQFRDLYDLCKDHKLEKSEKTIKIQESVKKFNLVIKDIDKLYEELMKTPVINPKLGKRNKTRYANWTKTLREKVNASVEKINY